MFGDAAREFEGLRRAIGFKPLEFLHLIGDMRAAIHRGATDEELETLRSTKYGKITPEQWAAILALVMQFIIMFGGA